MPFEGIKIAQQNMIGVANYPARYWKKVNPLAVDLVKSLM